MSMSARIVCNQPAVAYNRTTRKEGALAERVTVDSELCIGHGECVRIVPAGFALDDDENVSRPLPGASLVPLELLLDAARSCPTNAIEVRADDGAVLVASA
jgi:ferredoxin